ncbi:MAG TPA: HlyD family efflux transporter periplasmic adaptor subunit [Candidatus Polarisedimenticolaceae bacterium]|nr:HlyD family efflux transporter periplasmic adaptor subunit [Candidatus Polarisedimenticolaceae bacterium]
MRKRILWGAGAAVVLIAGWLAFGRSDGPRAVWATAERGDLPLTVEVTGTLQAVTSEAVGPPQVPDVWDFKIAMMAPEGKDVAAGEPVLGFDASELQRKLMEKSAESESAGKRIEKKEKDSQIARETDELKLAEARSRQRKTALELDVPEDLVKSRQLQESRLNLQDAEREITYLEAKLTAARAADAVALAALRNQKAAADRRVREIKEAIDAMTVRANRAGTVVYATGWRDEKKKVGDSAWRGERVLEIPDLTAMRAQGEVDESDAGRIRVGQKVRLRLEAHPDLWFPGKVGSIWSTVQQQSWRNPLKVMKLVVNLEATDPRKMRPGMRFRGVIETDRVPHALLVPADAVFPTEAGPVAFRKTAFGYERAALTLGARNETSVEIKQGLEEGDRVARRDLDAAERGGR